MSKKKKSKKKDASGIDNMFKELFKVDDDDDVDEVGYKCLENEGLATSVDFNEEPKSAYDFADIVRKQCHIKSVLDQKTLYIYNEDTGCFDPYSKEKFPTALFKYFRDPLKQQRCNSHFTNEVFHFLLHDESLQIQLNDFNEAPETYLNIQNGVFDFFEWKLKEHSPEYLFNYTLQVTFDENFKKPKKFIKFLKQAFDEHDDRLLCKQILAYILSNNTSIKVVWFFVGLANTGKSMLLKLISHMLGERYVASIPLEKLNDRFALGTVLHCRANIVAEVSNLKIKELKNLKMITGRDLVNVERKFADPQYISFSMKFLLAGNHLPKLEESAQGDDGINNRFQFLGFYNPVDESKRVSDYDQIIYEEEGNDIFFMLMKTLKEFYENDYKFCFTENSEALKAKFLHKPQKPIELFISQCCKQNPKGVEAISKIYEAYQDFCKYYGYAIDKTKSVVRQILQLPSHPVKQKKRLNKDGNPVSCITGIQLLKNSS